jgi:hypothetical protein
MCEPDQAPVLNKGSRRTDPCRVPAEEKNRITFIKLQLLQSATECCISETDSGLLFGYG